MTGAAVGTGRAIALAAGAEVVASDLDERRGQETVAQATGRASFVPADMTAEDDVRRLIATAEPQILVNNAGGGGQIPPHFPQTSPTSPPQSSS